MRILLLLAGTNSPSNSAILADAFLAGVRDAVPDATLDTVRIANLALEHFTLAHYNPETAQGPDYDTLKANVLAADGIVIATPIWNFSVPAHLKNLLDRMGTFALDAETRTKGTLKGKPFYFLYTGGAPVPAWKGLMRFTTMHVQEAIRYFGGSIFGKHFEGKCMLGRGRFGVVLDQRKKHLQSVRKKGMHFGTRVQRFSATGKLPLFVRIITRLYKLGQRIMAKF